MKDINNNLNSPSWGVYYEKEHSTYHIIGKERKKLKNEALEFHKYTEWKEHIEVIYDKIKNDENTYRFMVRMHRNKRNNKELLIKVAVPLELLMFRVFYTVGKEIFGIGTMISLLFSAAFLIIFVAINYLECKEEISFITDFIEIVFPEKAHNK